MISIFELSIKFPAKQRNQEPQREAFLGTSYLFFEVDKQMLFTLTTI